VVEGGSCGRNFRFTFTTLYDYGLSIVSDVKPFSEGVEAKCEQYVLYMNSFRV
jgi:hypothetical protein